MSKFILKNAESMNLGFLSLVTLPALEPKMVFGEEGKQKTDENGTPLYKVNIGTLSALDGSGVLSDTTVSVRESCPVVRGREYVLAGNFELVGYMSNTRVAYSLTCDRIQEVQRKSVPSSGAPRSE